MVTELYFDRAKSIRSAVISAAIGAVMVVLLAIGNANLADYHGRGSGLVRLLGPTNFRLLGGVLIAAFAFLVVLYVRQAFLKKPAAVIEDAGLRLQSIFGERFLPWAQIGQFELVQTGPARVLRIYYKKPSGRISWTGLATNTLAEGEDYVDLWIEAIRSRCLAAGGPG